MLILSTSFFKLSKSRLYTYSCNTKCQPDFILTAAIPNLTGIYKISDDYLIDHLNDELIPTLSIQLTHVVTLTFY
ncbi:hypothetical protein Hanom_Chr01g00030031 [Helianthus anomalus]